MNKNEKKLVQSLGFTPRENSSDVFIKKYKNNYYIEIDFKNESINYGKKISAGRKTTQNFKDDENWVVLECINRLLEKGYKPEDIVLEQKYTVGHGASGGWLDIIVKKEEKTFLMIECKTWGKEFEKEYKNLQKNGGQLFTYFQNDKNAEFLVLYASEFDEKNQSIQYKNEIVVIEDAYRETANVKDLFERWSKQTKNNGVFEDWTNAYNVESRALQMKDLKDIKQEDSSFIFNRFLEILRHNAVSDKGNAFTKIFTLFLCKVKDEDRNKTEELDFQWKDSDDAESFQVRLSDLYRMAMREFLDKEVSDFSDSDFEEKYGTLDESVKTALKKEFIKVRLQKSNEFAIKDVFDKETFEENNIVLKEVVELLQNFKFRYNKKQPFLGEFFELLLTTGLKQESGQFFTPVPVARFICKSVPLKNAIKEKLQQGERDELLPNVIDYAAGSGHFLTEAMEEIQNIVEKIDISDLPRPSKKEIQTAQIDPFGWAFDYIYGIERDYRLVKTTKVGCYLHGDGIANVIHGDGLDSFKNSKKYKGKLKKYTEENPTENGKFDFVLSNPPYSVSSFKGNTQNDTFSEDFELYKNLTDQSSEIEALFVERTKQLLKKDGISALILPASILSNSGIYTKAREIILKYFEIISIVELGSNTFMATGTSTVTLFLRRRSNFFWKKIAESVDIFFTDQKDKTVNGVENVFSKYVHHVFEDQEISFSDYQSLISGTPNENILKSEFFTEYIKKLSSKIYKTEAKKIEKILEIEKEKLLYFILVYPQEVVLANSGQKKEEKKFLGYEFSTRRGDEGLHAINRSKSVDECTSLYDEKEFYNPKKASTYILEAFEKKPKREIHENLKKNISRVDLVDMLTFDRVDFEKTVSCSVKKKIKIESRWEIVRIGDISQKIINGSTPTKKNNKYWENKNVKWATIPDFKENIIYLENTSQFIDKKAVEDKKLQIVPINSVLLSCTATIGKVTINKVELTTNQQINAIICNNKLVPEYLAQYLKTQKYNLENLTSNSGVKHINLTMLNDFKIPLPPIDIQQKIVDECEEIDSAVKKAEESIETGKEEISEIIKNISAEKVQLGEIANVIAGQSPKSEFYNEEKIGLPFYQGKKDFGDKELLDSGIYTSKITKESLKGSILMSVRAPVGDVNINPFEKICIGRGLASINTKDNYEQELLFEIIKWNKDLFKGHKGATFDSISRSEILEVKIPFPYFKTQQKIISEIKKIEAEISENQKIIDESAQKKEEILKKYL